MTVAFDVDTGESNVNTNNSCALLIDYSTFAVAINGMPVADAESPRDPRRHHWVDVDATGLVWRPRRVIKPGTRRDPDPACMHLRRQVA